MYLDDLRETYTDAGLAAYSGVLDTIEAKSLPQIYAAAAEAYSAQDYQTALADYTVLAARNYSDSDKRLFLTNAHLCDSLGQLALTSGMTNAQAAQKLMELIGFSDTNQVIMRDDSYAQAFLTGSWSSDAGELTVADDGTVTCSPARPEREGMHPARQRHLRRNGRRRRGVLPLFRAQRPYDDRRRRRRRPCLHHVPAINTALFCPAAPMGAAGHFFAGPEQAD